MRTYIYTFIHTFINTMQGRVWGGGGGISGHATDGLVCRVLAHPVNDIFISEVFF